MSGDEQWQRTFADRYGAGAYERLLALLDQPCVTFAEIATQFGVTRERVRQWHVELRPGAPRGHARQKLCLAHRRKKQLLEDPLFRTFYRHARPHLDAGRITLIRTRDGYTSRVVRLHGATVAIKHARRQPSDNGGKPAYILLNSQRAVDYIYYRLGDDDYLVVPRAALPHDRTTFLDTPRSKYQRFRKSFHAMQIAHLDL